VDDFMPRTVVIREAEESRNGKSRSYVFHMVYTYAPTGFDLTSKAQQLPSGTVATGEWRAYLALSDDRREVVDGAGLERAEIEAVLRAWLVGQGLLH
jgi:hypothetical protein